MKTLIQIGCNTVDQCVFAAKTTPTDIVVIV